ncbi:MarR family winged helix-turn-helix transcriptional regulator [Nocardia nepalensis]|uniref:MarR family winged helix-turn-helix transcriptional regulator n=1 Tax=Nocardia nepalensis TaxID=3375448 RepID=UPI003B679EC0
MKSEERAATDDIPSTSELVDVLQQTVGLVRAHFAAATAQLGVTPVQAKALRQLTEPITVKDLSTRLGADVSNTATTVDRLESQSLIRKDPHPTDRRARIVTLTDEGRRVLAKLEESAFSNVPALAALNPQQRRDLYTLLKRAISA